MLNQIAKANPIERQLNIQLLVWKEAWRMSWQELSETLKSHYSGEQLKYSVRLDTIDSLKASYCAPFFNFWFYTPDQVVNGIVAQKTREIFEDSGLNASQFIRRRWPHMKQDAVARRADNLRKNLKNRSSDLFTACFVLEIAGKPGLPSFWALNYDEKKALADDLGVKPRIAQMEIIF